VVACDGCEKCYHHNCLEYGFCGDQDDGDWLGPCCAPPDDGYDDGLDDGVGDDGADDDGADDDGAGDYMYSLLEFEDGPVLDTFKSKYEITFLFNCNHQNININHESYGGAEFKQVQDQDDAVVVKRRGEYKTVLIGKYNHESTLRQRKEIFVNEWNSVSKTKENIYIFIQNQGYSWFRGTQQVSKMLCDENFDEEITFQEATTFHQISTFHVFPNSFDIV